MEQIVLPLPSSPGNHDDGIEAGGGDSAASQMMVTSPLPLHPAETTGTLAMAPAMSSPSSPNHGSPRPSSNALPSSPSTPHSSPRLTRRKSPYSPLNVSPYNNNNLERGIRKSSSSDTTSSPISSLRKSSLFSNTSNNTTTNNSPSINTDTVIATSQSSSSNDVAVSDDQNTNTDNDITNAIINLIVNNELSDASSPNISLNDNNERSNAQQLNYQQHQQQQQYQQQQQQQNPSRSQPQSSPPNQQLNQQTTQTQTRQTQQQSPSQRPIQQQNAQLSTPTPTNTNQTNNPNDILLLQQFWRTYDNIIILSLFAIFGIVFRMASAAWFKLELGGVFSEDSALSTNLPLNCWSCFLMGLLCSGRDAMGIIHSKVLGGANAYGSGRGILDIGKGAYMFAVDAGRAGINRARGYGNVNVQNSSISSSISRYDNATATNYGHGGNIGSLGNDDLRDSPSNFPPSPSSGGLHRRRSNKNTSTLSTGLRTVSGSNQMPSLSSPLSPARGSTAVSHHNVSINQQREMFNSPIASPVSLGSNESIAGLLGLDEEFRIGSNRNSEDEIRDVQLRALSRRIMASSSLVFFPAKKEDIDVMEHYESYQMNSSSGYDDDDDDDDRGSHHSRQSGAQNIPQRVSSLPLPHQEDVTPNNLFEIGDLDNDEEDEESPGKQQLSPSGEASGQIEGIRIPKTRDSNHGDTTSARISSTEQHQFPEVSNLSNNTIEEELDEMFHSVSTQISNFRRLHVADGWDSGTTPEEMKHDILLGLRVGFCGAVSTFSSWNSAMINLLRNGKVGDALVGYALGIQLGIISYRFGQHLAVYIFVWRCRRETKRDEKRGYGLRLHDSDTTESADMLEGGVTSSNARNMRNHLGLDQEPADRDIPSVRALATSAFVMILISLFSALYFFPKHQQFSISLLFTPFGCLARWKLTKKYNSKLPGFPLGTFACNLLSCALSGSLGSILAGNPDPEERIVLTSMIAGFAGSLSTFAAFVVELLSLIDPIIFKFDGFAYAVVTIAWGMIIGICSSQAKNWADDI